jgi:hypothetical protein
MTRNERMQALIEDAMILLGYAAYLGKEIPTEAAATLTHTDSLLAQKAQLSDNDEVVLLSAYRQIAAILTPVTATSLKDTDDRYGRPGTIRARLGLRQLSKGKRFLRKFSWLAILFLAFTVTTEFAKNFIVDIFNKRTGLEQAQERKQKVEASIKDLEWQRQSIEGTVPVDHLDQKTRVASANVHRQLVDLEGQRALVAARIESIRLELTSGFKAVSVLFGKFGIREETVKNVIEPIAIGVTNFLLPMLYGALGACAYVLRVVIPLVHDRTFERRRAGDYGTRVYLGMLSGVAIQWLLSGATIEKEIAVRFTPATLAFIAGYSVEVLFTIIDTIIAALVSAVKGVAGRSGAASPSSSSPGGGGSQVQPK